MIDRSSVVCALIWLAAGCAPLPYKAEAEADEAEDKRLGRPADAPVVLYGYDENVPRKAPDGCIERGRVEASSLGEKSFPDAKLRKAAKNLGANGVTRIRSNGKEDGYLGVTRLFKGMAVSCK